MGQGKSFSLGSMSVLAISRQLPVRSVVKEPPKPGDLHFQPRQDRLGSTRSQARRHRQ